MEEDSSSQTPQEFQLPYQSVPIEVQNKRTHLDELHQIGKKTSGSNNINPLNISMAPPILPWPPIHQIGDHEIGQFYSSMHPHVPPPPFLHEFYTMRASTALQFGYEGINGVGPSSSDPLGLASQYFGGFASTSSPYIGKMSSQEIIDAKALAASKSHSEAERRRRERINAHLSKLRSMLPNTTKTDKASLLAEVIQHVKELKRQTSEIAEESPLPTESDELIVDTLSRDDNGHFVIRASLCCEDRSDLLPDLIKTLKSLHLRALKAEITTLAGRVKNVLLITGDETNCVECGDSGQSEQSSMPHQHSLVSIQEALREVMERTTSIDEGSGGSGTKRQRTTSVVDLS